MQFTSRRRVRGTAALAAAILIPLSLAACGESDDSGGGDYTSDLTMGTGSTGGVYYPLGQEYANLFVGNIDNDDLDVSAVETGASVENIAKISRGELQLGISQTNTAIDAVNGEGEFEDSAVDNVAFMGKLYPEAAQVITLESAGIDSIEDLEGKRIAIGPPGGGTRQAAEAILDAYGIEDFKPLEEGFDDARSKLQDGNADASIEILGVPASGLEELEATTNEVKLIPIEGKELDEIVDNTQFEEYELTPEHYDFLDEPVQTISVFAAMYGSTDQISEDLGYELTRVMYENASDLTLAQGELISKDEAALGQGDVPLHPGAERYFEEQGLLD